jgi:hypothetical protein
MHLSLIRLINQSRQFQAREDPDADRREQRRENEGKDQNGEISAHDGEVRWAERGFRL